MKGQDTPDTWQFQARYARVQLQQVRYLTRENRHRNWRFTLLNWASSGRLRSLEIIRGSKKQIVEQTTLF